MKRSTRQFLIATIACGAGLLVPALLAPQAGEWIFHLVVAATYALRLWQRVRTSPRATRIERFGFAVLFAPLESAALMAGWALVMSVFLSPRDPLILFAAPAALAVASLVLVPCAVIGAIVVHATYRHQQPEGLFCPRCGYRVDNLPVMRCPECGTVYTQDLPPRRA